MVVVDVDDEDGLSSAAQVENAASSKLQLVNESVVRGGRRRARQRSSDSERALIKEFITSMEAILLVLLLAGWCVSLFFRRFGGRTKPPPVRRGTLRKETTPKPWILAKPRSQQQKSDRSSLGKLPKRRRDSAPMKSPLPLSRQRRSPFTFKVCVIESGRGLLSRSLTSNDLIHSASSIVYTRNRRPRVVDCHRVPRTFHSFLEARTPVKLSGLEHPSFDQSFTFDSESVINH